MKTGKSRRGSTTPTPTTTSVCVFFWFVVCLFELLQAAHPGPAILAEPVGLGHCRLCAAAAVAGRAEQVRLAGAAAEVPQGPYTRERGAVEQRRCAEHNTTHETAYTGFWLFETYTTARAGGMR